MPPVSIPYAALTIPELVAIHNELALARGVSPLKAWHASRCPLVERVAILRTHKPLPPPPKKLKAKPAKRHQPVRNAIFEALSFVTHFECVKTGKRFSKKAAKRFARRKLFSVGLPYPEVLKRVQRHFPESTVSSGDLRWNAAHVRNRSPGFENCKLPQKRPHGTKGKRTK